MEIIAEIGQNHNGNMALAREMIACAKENGADAAKFQVYDARKLFPKENNPWFGYNCRTELSREDVGMLAAECKKIGIEFLASVFDVERISWLEEAGVRRHKVASRSIRDRRLLDAIGATNKPILVSLGMWVEEGFPELGLSNEIKFLHCISKYPADLTDVKLSKIDFQRYAGYSDHTIGISAAVTAFARGAGIVEKHFTLDKNTYGPDHASSMTPGELKSLDLFRKDIAKIL